MLTARFPHQEYITIELLHRKLSHPPPSSPPPSPSHAPRPAAHHVALQPRLRRRRRRRPRSPPSPLPPSISAANSPQTDLSHTSLEPDLSFHDSHFTAPHPSSAAHTIKPTNGALPTHTRTASASTKPKHHLLALPFYAQAFDVDTAEVLRRCLAAVYPRANFLDVLDGNPDLYGPFWIATTVVVILFLTGSISRWLVQGGRAGYAYDFRLLSGAAGLIYGYTAAIPLLLSLALRYLGAGGPDAPASALEHLSLYGYANVIWIPVALVSWSPVDVLNYVFVGVGLALSGLFLVRNLWPVISTTPAQRAKGLLVVVVLLHVGLAVAIKVLFFAHASPALKGGEDKGAGDDKGGESDSDGEGRLLRW